MLKNRLLLSAILVLFVGLVCIGTASAADKMTYDEYLIELDKAQKREAAALAEKTTIEGRISELEAQCQEKTAQIDELWKQIYELAGITPEQFQEFLAYIDELEARVDELSALRPEQRLERVNDLDALIDEVESAKHNPAAMLSQAKTRLDRLAARLNGLKSSLPKPVVDIYTVVKGDHLWGISGKRDIYNNSMQWPRIWSANRTELKDPDLIYPRQQLRVPRQIGRDQHLVAKGEFLSKIAGLPEVYGDPFEWRKIYQANKSGQFLEDPNVIYPEQILDIPRK